MTSARGKVMLGRSALRRLTLAAVLVVAGMGLAACQVTHLFLTVNNQLDAGDASPGDGVCEMHAGTGDCSLRAAIDEGNASLTLIPVITVPHNLYSIGGTAVVDDTNVAGDLDVAPASGAMYIDAQAVFLSRSGSSPGPDDGVLDVLSGSLVIDDSTIQSAAESAGLHVRAGALAVVDRSAFLTNRTGLVIDTGGEAVTRNATFTLGASALIGSTPQPTIAGVENNGTYSATYTTIYDNVGIGLGGSGTSTLQASIVANPIGAPACAGPVVCGGYNLDDDGSCHLTGTGDLSATDPELTAVGSAGSFVLYDEPYPSSPVLDSIPPGTPGLCAPGTGAVLEDQRSAARPGGTGCDRGAVELGAAQELVVNSPLDQHDAAPGDG